MSARAACRTSGWYARNSLLVICLLVYPLITRERLHHYPNKRVSFARRRLTTPLFNRQFNSRNRITLNLSVSLIIALIAQKNPDNLSANIKQQ